MSSRDLEWGGSEQQEQQQQEQEKHDFKAHLASWSELELARVWAKK